MGLCPSSARHLPSGLQRSGLGLQRSPPEARRATPEVGAAGGSDAGPAGRGAGSAGSNRQGPREARGSPASPDVPVGRGASLHGIRRGGWLERGFSGTWVQLPDSAAAAHCLPLLASAGSALMCSYRTHTCAIKQNNVFFHIVPLSFVPGGPSIFPRGD